MTKWLWIIGVTAVLWPIVLEHLGSGWLHRKLSGVLIGVANAADTQASNSDKRISELNAIVEKQDQLIAALWAKTYGYPFGEGGYVGDKYIASSKETLNEAWGVRPAWHVELNYVSDEFTRLTRDADYPWGKRGSLHYERNGSHD
jgi:hypothetical protein